MEANTTYEVRVVYVQAEYEVPAPTTLITTDSATLLSYALQRLEEFFTDDIKNGLTTVEDFVNSRLRRFSFWWFDRKLNLSKFIRNAWLDWQDSAPDWMREALEGWQNSWDTTG